MGMSVKVVWSDLLIDKGKLDPLGVWRVGDRLIGDLLAPFTTVVAQRPARLFSMYCWIFDHLSRQRVNDRRDFWERFYILEGALLCASQLHSQHSYEHFGGRIGSEHAAELLAKSAGGVVDLSGLRRGGIRNGWDVNYKNPMMEFYLTEVDFGVDAGIKLTDRGRKLAIDYSRAIRDTEFYRSHRNASRIPQNALAELSGSSCPCLLPSLLSERDSARRVLLLPDNHVFDHEDRDDSLWQSMFLVLDFMKRLRHAESAFSLARWRQALTTRCIAPGHAYDPDVRHGDMFRRWRLYALDSLFIFALESGLQGFLELLQKRGDLRESDFAANFDEQASGKVVGRLARDLGIAFPAATSAVIETLGRMEGMTLLQIEAYVCDRVQEATGRTRVAWSFALCLYATALYVAVQDDPDYADALDFYEKRASWDGDELSLLGAHDQLRAEVDLVDGLRDIFLREWVIGRQLQVRTRRRKEVAWFSYSRENRTYDWESDYHPTLYRASRIDIFLAFLLNMDVVRYEKGGWHANPAALTELGV